MSKKLKTYIIAIIIPLSVGGLSTLLTMGNMNIYSEINTPPLAPPAILFPVVWSILYILMGVSSAMIALSNFLLSAKTRTLFIYGISLFVNFFWSIFFFNMQAFLFSFVWLVLLLWLIILTIIDYSKINNTAAYLQIPYLLWVTFAGYLNFAIYLLN